MVKYTSYNKTQQTIFKTNGQKYGYSLMKTLLNIKMN